MNTKFILFDGCDKCGKSTLIKALHQATDYKHVIVDRGILSNIVYGKFNCRNIDEKELLQMDETFSKVKFIRQIIVTADLNDVLKRFEEHNEVDLEDDEVPTILSAYVKYSKVTKIPTLVLDTSRNDLNKCVDIILKWLEK